MVQNMFCLLTNNKHRERDLESCWIIKLFPLNHKILDAFFPFTEYPYLFIIFLIQKTTAYRMQNVKSVLKRGQFNNPAGHRIILVPPEIP